MFRKTSIVAACVVMSMCLSALAVDKDLSSPKATAKTFAQALVAADEATAKAACTGTPEQMEMVSVMVGMVSGMKKVEDAAVAKFGDAGKGFIGQKGLGDELLKQCEDAEEKIDGDTATLQPKENDAAGKKPEPMKLKKVGSEWKLDLAELGGAEKDQMAKAMPAMKAMGKVFTQVADDIKADKYKTVAAAKEAFQQRVMTAMMAAMQEGAKDEVESKDK